MQQATQQRQVQQLDWLAARVQVAQRRLAAIPGCAVEAEPFRVFWPAEVYHQQYLEVGASVRREGAGMHCAAAGWACVSL